jgi:3-oxoacyl-[acyl-carrier-protein] synthase II
MGRVVVTGIGAVTPLGNSFSLSWKALKTGRTGISKITRFDASLIPWRIAGELRGFDPRAYLAQKEVLRLDPFVQYSIAAAVMAVEDAGLISTHSLSLVSPFSDHLGVIIGSSRGGISTIEKSFFKAFRKLEQKKDDGMMAANGEIRLRPLPSIMPSTTVGMAASYIAQKLGIKGACLGVSNACASGANAIGEAFRMVKSGYARMVLAGGTDAPICRWCIEGYGAAGTLSRCDNPSKDIGAPRPFDMTRDGFVLSEGACVLLLEEYASALRRGIRLYGEIAGYGNTSDARHMTRPDPSGEARGICAALKESGIDAGEVEHFNTHGTATHIGDLVEVQAFRKVFGARATKVPATAVKSMTGHMLAASGAFEVASTLMTLHKGIIPPTINLKEKDPTCDLALVTEKTNGEIRTALSTSFGFGGVNAVVVLKRI